MHSSFPKLHLHLLATPKRLVQLSHAELASELKRLPPKEASEQLMSIDFESAAEQLQRLDRMFFEMDGSFVWTGENSTESTNEPARWQVDGMVYDVGGQIQRLELKGLCSKASWRKLLAVLNWPAQPLIIYDITNAGFEAIDTLESRTWEARAGTH